MFEILSIVAGLLLITILYLIYRVVRIYIKSRSKEKEEKWIIDRISVGSNKWNAYLMLLFVLVFLALFWGYALQSDWLPEVASVHGEELDELFWTATVIILIPFTLLHLILFWAAFRYRYQADKEALYYTVNNKLEASWTVITAAVLIILIYVGIGLWNNIKSAPPEDAEKIEILGAQFVWFIRYPGADRELGETDYRLIDDENHFGMNLSDPASHDDFFSQKVHIPKGRPVVFLIKARDVIHSVFAPHFRLKMDAVPGMTTRFWFTAKYTTEEMRKKLGDPDFNYEIACAEICGRGHFAMRAIIVVHEPEEYNEWYEQQSPWLSGPPERLSKKKSKNEKTTPKNHKP